MPNSRPDAHQESASAKEALEDADVLSLRVSEHSAEMSFCTGAHTSAALDEDVNTFEKLQMEFDNIQEARMSQRLTPFV